MNHFMKGQFYKETTLQVNYLNHGRFPIIALQNSMADKIACFIIIHVYWCVLKKLHCTQVLVKQKSSA